MNLIDYLKLLRKKIKNIFVYNTYFDEDDLEEELYDERFRKEEEYMPFIDNSKEFPNNIFPPEDKKIDNKTYKFYKARFNSLYEIYEYLKSNPNLNRKVFRKLSSETNDSSFAGRSYEKSVEDLVSDVDPGYQEFLQLQNDINNARKIDIHKYVTVKTIAGGHINIPAYAAGAPLCYETEEKVKKPKFIRIFVTLSYYWRTSKEQVLNRAIIITNVLKALERAGYNVDLNTFEMSYENDEVVYINVKIKKFGQKMNMAALYKTLCHVEFLRRILFRILETLAVTNDWGNGYGVTCSESFVRKALNLGSNDIFFDQPNDMNINGKNLAEDFVSAIKHLNLEDKIDVEKAKKEFKEDVKTLIKRREENC